MATFEYPLGTAGTLVNERFNQAESIGINAFNTSLSTIQSLQTIVQQLTLIDRTISIDTTTVSPIAISETPPVIDTDAYRMDMPTLPTEPTIVDANIGTLPDFPDLVIGDAPVPNETYNTTLLSEIKSKMLSDLSGGAIGIPDTVQAAMFQRDYERMLNTHNDSLDRRAATVARSGYPIPNGVLRGAYDEEEILFTNKRFDMSRDIAIKSFELALSNYHFIIQQGIAIESQLMNYAHQVAQLAFQAADEAIKNAISAFKERSSNISTRITAILETAKTKIQYNVSLIEMFTAKLGAYSAKINGEASRVTAVAKTDEARVNLFTSIANFDIAKGGLDIKVLDTRINQAIANAGLLIKDKEVEMKNYELINTLRIRVMEAIGQIASQIVAGAYAGVSASAGIRRDDSSSYSETHSYQEET